MNAFCPECDEYMCGNHICPPPWAIWCPEDGETLEDAHIFYAVSPERAVEKWAHWYDVHAADYSILSGSDITVEVKNMGRFTVYGESLPSYSVVRSKT